MTVASRRLRPVLLLAVAALVACGGSSNGTADGPAAESLNIDGIVAIDFGSGGWVTEWLVQSVAPNVAFDAFLRSTGDHVCPPLPRGLGAAQGGQLVVTNEENKTIAVTTIESPGTWFGYSVSGVLGFHCRLGFTITDLPVATFYTFSIDGVGEETFTHEDLEASGPVRINIVAPK